MDRFGDVQFTVAQSPVPPAPPQPKPEEPKGPSEIEELRQQLKQVQSNYEHLQSNKDAKINQLTEQVELLNSTLRDQLTQRPTAQEVASNQPPAVDSFWDDYFNRGNSQQQQSQPAPTQQARTQQEINMEPKEIKKLVREEVNQMVNKAQEQVVSQTQTHQQLVEKFQNEYKHLHHATAQVNEIWNNMTTANPNMDPTERFNMVMSMAEKILPPSRQGSSPSPFAGGGQGGSYAPVPNAGGTTTRMVNGLPVRDMDEPRQALNDYIIERQQAQRNMMRGPR